MNSFRVSLAFVLFAAWGPSASAYSVLTHEAIIDAAWDRSIQPLLLQRFPGLTPEDVQGATEAPLCSGPDTCVPNAQLVGEKSEQLRAVGLEPRWQWHEVVARAGH